MIGLNLDRFFVCDMMYNPRLEILDGGQTFKQSRLCIYVARVSTATSPSASYLSVTIPDVAAQKFVFSSAKNLQIYAFQKSSHGFILYVSTLPTPLIILCPSGCTSLNSLPLMRFNFLTGSATSLSSSLGWRSSSGRVSVYS